MLKNLICSIIFLTSFSSFSQDIFSTSSLSTIKIHFQYANWDFRLDTAYAGAGGYILADSVVIDGRMYDSVGIKYKGFNTYNALNIKNPFNIKLDFIKGKQDHQGYKNIKLGNAFGDPSLIRDPLSNKILSKYMDCGKIGFSNVSVNNTLIGLYSSSQSLDKRYFGDHFYSANGAEFKCNPIIGATPSSTELPDLNYLGADSALYYSRYELQSNHGWKQLVNLIDTLNNSTTNTELALDIDRVLWMHAFNNSLVSLDSYLGSYKQNYYLYHDLNSRFAPTISDMNLSFGAFPGSGPTPANTDPLLNATSVNHPLIAKLFANDTYKKMYMAHLRTIIAENFTNSAYVTDANAMRALIGTSVAADVNKFFTTSNYSSSLTTAVGAIPGIQTLMTNRLNYLNANAEFLKVPPTIGAVTIPATVAYGSNIPVKVSVNTNTGVFLGFRYDKTKRFFRVPMFDDGLHNDGAANDGVFGANIDILSGQVQYYIYAENANAGIFSPVRAEHEFFSIFPTSSAPLVGELRINEINTNNVFYRDEYNDKDDWVELYNNSNKVLNLNGLYLTDNFTTLQEWPFPAGLTISPNKYMIVWLDKDSIQGIAHTSFKVSSSGDNLIIANSIGTIIDQVTWPLQTAGLTYGRLPNGTGPFQTLNADTYAQQNSLLEINELSQNELDILAYPNPTTSELYIQNAGGNQLESIQVVSITGTILIDEKVNQASEVKINTKEWAIGVYMVTVRLKQGDLIVKKVIKE